MRLFEDEFMDIQSDIIGMCLDFVDDEVDKVYAYGYINEKSTRFNVFFVVDSKAKWTHEFAKNQNEIFEYLDEGIEYLEKMAEICKRYGQRMPTELRMVYDNQTGKYESTYVYEELETEDLSAGEIFRSWKEEVENELAQKKS